MTIIKTMGVCQSPLAEANSGHVLFQSYGASSLPYIRGELPALPKWQRWTLERPQQPEGYGQPNSFQYAGDGKSINLPS